MRFIFKTDYNQDLRLLKHSGYWWSYGVLALLLIAAPFGLQSGYLITQLVFVFIYALVGVSLTILTGFTGQVSLGHAAFLAIGAYTAGFLQSKGFGFIVYFPAAIIITGIVGMLVAIPALRLSGIYLVIATIAFAFIIEEVAARWETVTHGNEGIQVKAINFFGTKFFNYDISGDVPQWLMPRSDPSFYFLCLGSLVLMIVLALNIARSPTGRAFMAIRDSETAAKSMGVNLALYKVKSFTISAAITGMAGVLYAHQLAFITPEMFNLLLSLEFIMVIIIGGIIGLHGAVLGAIFIVMVDPFLTLLKDDVPGLVSSIALMFGVAPETASSIGGGIANIGSAPGMKGALYGLIIIFFIIFEPYGIYGRWLKVKLYFQLFPLYKKATFKRQKTYVKSERNR